MTNSIEIRYARPRDVEQILDLFEEVADELLWIGPEPGFDRDRKRASFLDAIARPDELPFWVACDGAGLAGSASIFHHAEAGLAIGMLVRASYRRRGIGQALIERSFTWARDHGVGALSLHVFPHNLAARALYQKAGFREIDRFERDITRQTGDVWDTILMRKEFA
ncbi:MAG TPA: GNAT family N-acetyltransferase [Candidatus Tumulicola sp.]